jgi:hypothetical protein
MLKMGTQAPVRLSQSLIREINRKLRADCLEAGIRLPGRRECEVYQYSDTPAVRFRFYNGEGRCEISFLPDELPAITEAIISAIRDGEKLPLYTWTARAWAANRHHDPARPVSPEWDRFLLCYMLQIAGKHREQLLNYLIERITCQGENQ